MITPEKTVGEYIQKEMTRVLNCYTTKKNQLNTKENSNSGNE